jgi:hypothetical protein
MKEEEYIPEHGGEEYIPEHGEEEKELRREEKRKKWILMFFTYREEKEEERSLSIVKLWILGFLLRRFTNGFTDG